MIQVSEVVGDGFRQTQNYYLYGYNKSTMNLAVRKVEIIEWLTQLKDEQLIDKVEKLKRQSIKASYESRLKPMTSKAYKAMLEESENDFKKGRVISQESLEEESRDW